MKVNTKKALKEGLMAELEILAQESQTYQEFEKKFIEEYGEGQPLQSEEKSLLQKLFGEAKALAEIRKAGIVEVVKSPVNREIVTMICEVANDFGVRKIPNKKWASTVGLVRFIVERLDKKDRIRFVKIVKNLRESMGVEEYIINVD